MADIWEYLKRDRLFWSFVLILSFSFFLLVPLVGDDMTFLAYSKQVNTFTDVVDSIVYMYQEVNGRILGNLSSVLFAKSILLSSIVKAVILSSIFVFAVYSATQNRESKLLRNTTIIILLFLPVEIFREAIAWQAGFFNYVAPVSLVLAILYLTDKIFSNKTKKTPISIDYLLFTLGFLSCFFTESISLGLLVISLALLFYSILWHRYKIIPVLTLLLGVVLGVITMFLSPAYKKIAEGRDNYREVGSSLLDYVNIIFENITNFTNYLISGNSILYIALSLSCIILLLTTHKATHKGKEEVFIGILLAVLICAPLYFFVDENLFLMKDFSNDILYYVTQSINLFIALAYFYVIICTVVMRIKDINIQRRIVLYIITGLLTVCAVLAVKPFGARNFYISYILFAMAAMQILLYLSILHARHKGVKEYITTKASYFIMAMIIFMYFAIYSVNKIRDISIQRTINAAISNHNQSVAVKRYPFAKYLHDSDNSEKSKRYYANCVCTYATCDRCKDFVIIFTN